MIARPWPALLLAVLFLTACGGPDHDEPAPSPAHAPTSWLLEEDFEDALGVVAVKARAPGEEVVVHGRVRSTADGVFVLVDDDAVQYCDIREGDECATPWDYCCENADDVRAASIVVEVQDAEGNPIAQADLGIRPVDHVAFRATLRAEGDEPVLVARHGWYRRERPPVGPDVHFP
jgi:hypothetical protein